jgi:transcriptional regulator with XRE-family HTH domain
MARKAKHFTREKFGAYLKKHREDILKEKNLLNFSYSSKFDNSKLAKIEKGEIDIQFDTLIEIAKTYKLVDKGLFGFSPEDKALNNSNIKT